MDLTFLKPTLQVILILAMLSFVFARLGWRPLLRVTAAASHLVALGLLFQIFSGFPGASTGTAAVLFVAMLAVFAVNLARWRRSEEILVQRSQSWAFFPLMALLVAYLIFLDRFLPPPLR